MAENTNYTAPDKAGGPPLPTRATTKRMVVWSLAFCGLMLAYLAGFGKDTELQKAIVDACLYYSIAVMTGYVLRGTVDTVSLFNAMRKR